MVATNLKSETMALMERRASMEAEMNAIIESLCGPGGPGISGDLVDREGFPRSDIDIPAIRSQRARVAALRNDHRDITDKIEKNLQVLHSVRVAKVAPLPSEDSDTSVYVHESTSQDSSMGEEPIVRIPFAMIDEIADDSPAAEDGLQLGDEILKFGNVEIGGELQSRLVLEAHSSQGHPISMMIIRQGSVMNLNVTPRPWRGRGLLGSVYLILFFSGAAELFFLSFILSTSLGEHDSNAPIQMPFSDPMMSLHLREQQDGGHCCC